MYQLFVTNMGVVDTASTLTEARKKLKQLANAAHYKLLKSLDNVTLVRTAVETSCSIKGQNLYAYYIYSSGVDGVLLFSCYTRF